MTDYRATLCHKFNRAELPRVLYLQAARLAEAKEKLRALVKPNEVVADLVPLN